MLTTEERFVENRNSWFNISPQAGILHTDQEKARSFEYEGKIPVHEYLNIEVKEEFDDECIKERERVYTKLETHSSSKFCSEHFNCQISKGEDFEKLQAQNFKQIYTLFYPGYLQKLNSNFRYSSPLNASSNPTASMGTDKVNGNGLLSLRFQLSPWETERILRRREQNRKRKALQRAQETDEQKNLRREKERLAKAALRATESLEKRLIRRERDRIAKAMSRATETEEQRRQRREKNRIAMAALRAAQSEEERFIRREKDRIKKATIRAFETEEQKRIRREKNRIAMAIRRANSSEPERDYLRNVNTAGNAASKSCLTAEERAFLMKDTKLCRDGAINTTGDRLELISIRNSVNCLNGIEPETDEERGLSSEGDEENSGRKGRTLFTTGYDMGDSFSSLLLACASTNNQNI